jgi:pyridoxal phosphate enzyme (YggS family)
VADLSPARVRANLARIREAVGPDVEVLAAVKYLPADALPALAEAGVTLFGENRAQQLEEKVAANPGLPVRWHFIGQLQSRKVKQVLPHVELIHSVASESALAQLARHGTPETEVLLEVNVAGEAGKAGIAPDELPRYLELAAVRVTGLMTMPPATPDPEGSRRSFAALRELAAAHALPRLSMGTSQDYAVAAQEGATIVRIGSALYS